MCSSAADTNMNPFQGAKMVSRIQVDQERLWDSHLQMARIGALPNGGCCRLALSEEDKVGRDLFVEWCRDAGCEIRIDQIGNIFARRNGTRSDRLPVATGSHLDTQPHGGKFDGVYGVLAGLEVIRTLNDQRVETSAPIEVIVWTNEEGARFAPPLTGSQVFVGRVPVSEAHSLPTSDGGNVLDDLKNIGYYGEELNSKNHGLACFVECHIEQGPILELENQQIGIVTMIQGLMVTGVRVKGFDNHAGTTPMSMRKDALVGASKMVVKVNEIGQEHDSDTRVTVGRFDVLPNSTSSIPGEVCFHIDLRHPDSAKLKKLENQARHEINQISSESGLEADYEQILDIAPTIFHTNVIRAAASAAQQLGYSCREMISGAGHDAMNVATIAPTAMIFVPCEGGISHNESESATPEDLAAGANVLLHSLVELAESTASC